ncbi:hypothetical protein FQN50_006140 [Emmonsiellopsis sp. PD_5]|nr:hypothetical protein FQN50_006140 [Emmonsiellopsis sp. PD_5]
MESFTNYLGSDEYQGVIDGIEVRWSNPAKDDLPRAAERMKVTEAALKRVTEHIAHASAKRRKLSVAIVRGTLHDTTTNSKTGEIKPDMRHCTVTANPGKNKTHIYVTGMTTGEKAFDTMTVVGESVIKNGTIDPDQCMGTFPPL